jgi:hypothetical protein
VRRSLLLVPLLLLLTAAPALAGGFATVGLSSMPAGVGPGDKWNVDITVLGHGRTPADGLSPSVVIRSGDTTREFPAKATGEPGVYRAAVVFPTAGRWSYEVPLTEYGTVHTFAPVEIGDDTTAPAPAAPPAPVSAPVTDDGGGIAGGWLLGAGAALLLALAVLGFDRRRRQPGVGSPEPA